VTLALTTVASTAGAQSAATGSSLFAPPPSLAATVFAPPSTARGTEFFVGRPSATRLARQTARPPMLAQSGDAQTRARARFEDGIRLANELQWAQAAAAFEESYQLFQRPNTLFNLGLAHRALGRYTRSIEELERFLQEGTPTPEQRTEVSSALEQMRTQLARLTVVPSVESARITIDGSPANLNDPVTLDPGNHVIEVVAQGYVRNAQTLTLRQGETRRLDVRMEQGGGISTGAVVGIVAGVVAAGAATGVLIWALSGEERPYCGTLNQCIMPQ
jgi:hypothetical protein